ncbi:MAG TPA: hypothetical protein VJS44_00045, partial [Pyrinomonadaceae bacterium]|nr:hypothetical protein [Pyrinomonadaceae bacterium]
AASGTGMMRFVIMAALALCAFATGASAQQAGRRATPSLTSEDLLDRPSYNPVPVSPARVSSSINATSRLSSVGALYRDPSGAFSLNLPSANWRLNTKSEGKGKLSDLRVFRKLDADGFASATASVYVLSSTAALSLGRVAEADAVGQRALAEALAARFLSSSSEVVSASLDRKVFQVVADQMVSRRAVVRASIHAFEQAGRLYVIVCRAPLESFDSQAREFSAITQSLASSVARPS